jgi:hypothetical protein
MTDGSAPDRWLLLIHQIPPKPAYFRVKIWRRLQGLGAITLKNTVYVLPCLDQTSEDLQWLAREIREGGGDAFICEAAFVEGISSDQLRGQFQAARDEEYAAIAEAAQALAQQPAPDGRPDAAVPDLARLRKRLAEAAAIDFFGAPGRMAAEQALGQLALAAGEGRKAQPGAGEAAHLWARTWVTRAGVQVDRMASAWLIRRFIDPEARFKFVAEKGHRAQPGEVRYDMFEAEYTHEGDMCTFEVLAARFRPDDAALAALAQVIHDIDLKDDKFQRPEAAGLKRLIDGIASAHERDDERLARSAAMLDDLYAAYGQEEPRP